MEQNNGMFNAITCLLLDPANNMKGEKKIGIEIIQDIDDAGVS
jgi:hypothetical protein